MPGIQEASTSFAHQKPLADVLNNAGPWRAPFQEQIPAQQD